MKKYNPYENRPSHAGWRRDLYDIIFGADTPPGKAFDIGLILAILASVIVVMLDSVQSISAVHHHNLYMLYPDHRNKSSSDNENTVLDIYFIFFYFIAPETYPELGCNYCRP